MRNIFITMTYISIAFRECIIARVKFIEQSKGLRGDCYPIQRKIVVPNPISKKSLAIVLHEVGHLTYFDYNKGKIIKPRYYSEYLADKFTRMIFKKYKLFFPFSLLDEQKSYVSYCLHKSLKQRRTNFSIILEVKQWLNE